jgi:hypothetical protein
MQLLDLVGAVGQRPDHLEMEIQKLYDWHHARGVIALQVALAPAAVAALAIVAKGVSSGVIVAAAVILVVGIGIGLWQTTQLNRLHGEYVLALRLAIALSGFHDALALYLHGERFQPIGRERAAASTEPWTSIGAGLYAELGDVTMVGYQSHTTIQKYVKDVIERHGALLTHDLGDGK